MTPMPELKERLQASYLAGVEKVIGVPFPDQLKSIYSGRDDGALVGKHYHDLIGYNYGNIFSQMKFRFTPINVEAFNRCHKGLPPSFASLVPFGHDDFGNLYLLQPLSWGVYFLEIDDDKPEPLLIYQTFEEFLVGLQRR
jgi:hypothetical protein